MARKRRSHIAHARNAHRRRAFDVSVPIPPEFAREARRWWGNDEAEAFLEALERPPTRGVRIDRGGPSMDVLERALGIECRAVPWSRSVASIVPNGRVDGLTVDLDGSWRGLGSHPLHVAGAFYLQDPAATIVAAVANVRPDEHVVDLAAAPGGKATALASAIQSGPGTLLANDVHAKRVTELGRNLERMGAKRAIVTQAAPERLAAVRGATSDVVVLDAPCSGEGMFRKSHDARRDWSLAAVERCARRQETLIDAAADLVAPGGRLVYSTCTFSPRENEAVVATLLRRRADFAPVDLEVPGVDVGRPEWVGADDVLPATSCARLWPHRSVGDGHTVIVVRRADDARPRSDAADRHRGPRDRGSEHAESERAWRHFLDRHVVDPRQAVALLGPGTTEDRDGTLWHVPTGWQGIGRDVKTLRPGLALGTVRGGTLEPSHALGRAWIDGDLMRRWSVPHEGATTRRWIDGEEIDLEAWRDEGASPLRDDASDGFVQVCVEGVPLGWGLRRGGRFRNLRPRGLRGHA